MEVGEGEFMALRDLLACMAPSGITASFAKNKVDRVMGQLCAIDSRRVYGPGGVEIAGGQCCLTEEKDKCMRGAADACSSNFVRLRGCEEQGSGTSSKKTMIGGAHRAVRIE